MISQGSECGKTESRAGRRTLLREATPPQVEELQTRAPDMKSVDRVKSAATGTDLSQAQSETQPDEKQDQASTARHTNGTPQALPLAPRSTVGHQRQTTLDAKIQAQKQTFGFIQNLVQNAHEPHMAKAKRLRTKGGVV